MVKAGGAPRKKAPRPRFHLVPFYGIVQEENLRGETMKNGLRIGELREKLLGWRCPWARYGKGQ